MKDIKKFLEALSGDGYKIRSVEEPRRVDDTMAYKIEVELSVERKGSNPFANSFEFDLDDGCLSLESFTCAETLYKLLKEKANAFGIDQFEIDYDDNTNVEDIDLNGCDFKEYYSPQTMYSPKEEGFNVYGTVIIPLMFYVYD